VASNAAGFSPCWVVSLAASLKILGGRIRESRKRKGFSQEGLALAADIDRSFMGQVERGQRNVSFATLYRLATVIDATSQTCVGTFPDWPVWREPNRG